MAGTMRKMGVYLGLLEDGVYDDDYLDEQDVAPARERQRPAVREAVSREPREPVMAGAMPGRGEPETTGEVARLDDRRRVQAHAGQPGPSMSAAPERREPSAPVGAPATRVAPLSRIVTLHPRTYNEARVIGENFRDGVPVIMNLSEMDDDDAKRLVDFAAGLIFGVRGSIERVTNKVFLLSPPNVSVAAEDKQRIAEGGFFNQS